MLSAAPYGETALVAHILTEEFGPVRGLVHGGASRAKAAIWQPGNLITASWKARLSTQLGTLNGEMVHATAARLLDNAFILAMLTSICAVADGVWPEHEPHPALFHDTIALVALLGVDQRAAEHEAMAHLLRWERALLADMGFGMDWESCAVTGSTTSLAWVSPRTGRAVSEEGAGLWKARLLKLPAIFFDDQNSGNAQDWFDGLRLTGHFLARDAFGQRHQPLPAARERLADLVFRRIPRD